MTVDPVDFKSVTAPDVFYCHCSLNCNLLTSTFLPSPKLCLSAFSSDSRGQKGVCSISGYLSSTLVIALPSFRVVAASRSTLKTPLIFIEPQ